MRELFLIALIVSWSSLCFSQEPTVALELPEYNILYRGYPNKIIPAVTNNDGAKIKIVGAPELNISNSDEKSYTVNPKSRKKYALLHVVLISEDKIDTIRTVKYRLVNLPDPTLYWGGCKNESKASVKVTRIFAKYPPEISLNAVFSVRSWEVFFNGNSISGKGSNISEAEDLLKTIKTKSEVTIEAVITGPDGVERKIIGTWKVIPWDEETDKGLIEIKCTG